ncbi:MAG TPA: hypothetical protein VNL96_06425 [Gemmatimonadaceae bacterium]|nr:hypothetical protein [Gemmatimonadaceae bacterium]
MTPVHINAQIARLKERLDHLVRLFDAERVPHIGDEIAVLACEALDLLKKEVRRE